MAEFAVFATSQDKDRLLETALVALGLKAYPSPIPAGNPIAALATPEQIAHYISEQPRPWPATTFFLAGVCAVAPHRGATIKTNPSRRTHDSNA